MCVSVHCHSWVKWQDELHGSTPAPWPTEQNTHPLVYYKELKPSTTRVRIHTHIHTLICTQICTCRSTFRLFFTACQVHQVELAHTNVRTVVPFACVDARKGCSLQTQPGCMWGQCLCTTIDLSLYLEQTAGAALLHVSNSNVPGSLLADICILHPYASYIHMHMQPYAY